MRYPTSPGVAGTLIDSETKQPLADAEVFISKAIYGLPTLTNALTGEVERIARSDEELLPPKMADAVRKARLPIVVTDSNGHFYVPCHKSFGFVYFLVDTDQMVAYGTLVIRRKGYVDTLRFLYSPPTIVDVGKVPMKSEKQ